LLSDAMRISRSNDLKSGVNTRFQIQLPTVTALHAVSKITQ
jgi:hypothetical protein